jgi:hypothetical protein
MPLPLVLALSSALAPAALGVSQLPDAGPDQVRPWPGTVPLQGAVAGHSPLEWWTADGNNATEDHLVKSTPSGPVSVGPLRTAGGTVLGWPGDLVPIGSELWGVDVGQRRLYRVDPSTGICTLAGSSPFSSLYTSVNSLAYDAPHDRLFAVDMAKKQLLLLDRSTGQVSTVGGTTLSGYPLVRSLAYDEANDRLLAHDNGSGWLLSISPATGAVTPLVVVQPDPEYRTEELEFHAGELVSMRGRLAGGILVAGQLARLDPTTGVLAHVGAELADCSPHSLRAISVPERVQWSLASGPGSASFADAGALDTTVTFSAAGVYQLDLTVYTSSGAVTDSVQITADGCPNDPLQILPGNCQDQGAPYCFGDGSATACPCGNASGADRGCRNSSGQGARLSNTGGTSVAADDALFSCTEMPANKTGLIYYGTQPKNGLAGAHFGDGLRCVAGTVRRFSKQSTGASGAFAQSQPVAASAGALSAGSTWYFQAWFRDDASVCGNQSNLSNGLAVTFQP